MRLLAVFSKGATFRLALVPLVLLAGTWFAAKSAVDHLLYHDAVMTGRSWTSYLVENIKDLEGIAGGAEPTAESRTFFDRAQKAGQVFRSVIYDPEGRTRFVADRTKEDDAEGRVLSPSQVAKENAPGKAAVDDDDDENLAQHNPAAASAVASGQALVKAEEGEPPTRPEFFSEAYLPVTVGGKVVAVVETYIDQTEKRTEYRRTLVFLTCALLALVAAAFGVPGLAWLKRSNEKRLADAHIRFLAHHDPLTGLINRSRLTEEMEARLSGPNQAGFALHYVDVDNFKGVNDSLGHDAGDALIVSVSGRLQELTERGDVVARVGGDEFVLLQDSSTDEAIALAKAGQIRQRLSLPYELNGQAVNMTVSIGVAVAPQHGLSVARLMKSADLAAFASKSAGQGRTSLFKPEMDRHLSERLSLERAIREAVAAGAFELYYQPSVKMPERKLEGFEALLRMKDRSGSMVSPATFIPIAEQMGLIDRIGEWVLREACNTAAHWPAHLKVAVNLSPAQFAGNRLTALVEEILRESRLEARRLELEITEGLLLSKSADVMDELRKLKSIGVGIVMDDFGTGYSSLSYLWQFPFDKIKIDRAFMLALDGEDRGNAEAIVRTIIDLGRSLNVTVTVEGVENSRQMEFVSAAGCNQIQGYFFGRPMPQSDLAAHIAKSMANEIRSDLEGETEPRIARAG